VKVRKLNSHALVWFFTTFSLGVWISTYIIQSDSNFHFRPGGLLLWLTLLVVFLKPLFKFPLRLRAGRSGILGFDSRRGLGIFLFAVSRTALEPIQPPIQCVPGTLSLGIKRPGREADHSPLSSAEVKNAWSYTSTPSVHLHGVVLS
jgi:hypothetical protein